MGAEVARQGRELVRMRVRAGLSARELAAKAGVSAASVLRAERGEPLNSDVRAKLAAVLGEDVFALVPGPRAPGEGAPPVRWARFRAGLTQEEAATLAGVTPGVIARAERGLGVRPVNARRIALAFNLDVLAVLPIQDDDGDGRAS